MSRRLIRVRDDNVLEILDTAGQAYATVHPGYEERLGPCIHIKRVLIHDEEQHLLTLRLASLTALVRSLPVVVSAARRLQNGAKKPAK